MGLLAHSLARAVQRSEVVAQQAKDMMPPILCILNTPWDVPVPTNRQQLMRRFGERTPVAVIEAPLPVLGSMLGRSTGRRRSRGWRRDGNVHILQAWDWIPYPLTKRFDVMAGLADRALQRTLQMAVASQWRLKGWRAPVLWFYAHDSADLLGLFGEQLALYHCVDDYAATTRLLGHRRVTAYSARKREETLVREVDLLVVTSPRLLERWQFENAHTSLLTNVADTALFEQALLPGPEHAILRDIPKPLVCFIGALDAYKVDFALLAGLAALRPDIHFVCVGPVGIGDGTGRSKLPVAGNLHYFAPVPQAELPAVMRGCAACLIPYHLNDYTLGVSPLKLYEYLAAGQPVVATPLPALLAERPPGLFISEGAPDAFAVQLERAMAVGEAERREISRQAQGHSWERRVDELEALIRDRLASKAAALEQIRAKR